jgi:hypothetical protein
MAPRQCRLRHEVGALPPAQEFHHFASSPDVEARAQISSQGRITLDRAASNSFGRPLFGYPRGLVIVDSFYEKVMRSKMEKRMLVKGAEDENVVMKFSPRD